MSESPFEQSRRVAVACRSCRKTKTKCMTNSQEEPCLRCQMNGLVCEYAAPDKDQRARGGAGGKGRSHNSPGQSPTTPTFASQPSSHQDGGEVHLYHSYEYSGGASRTRPQYAAPPPMGPPSYSNSSNAGTSHRHRGQPVNNSYQSIPAGYDGMNPYYGSPHTNVPGSIQPMGYPGHSAQHPSGYTTDYQNYPYDWNSSNPSGIDDSHNLSTSWDPLVGESANRTRASNDPNYPKPGYIRVRPSHCCIRLTSVGGIGSRCYLETTTDAQDTDIYRPDAQELPPRLR
ncbi:hypothetical protein R3P38DRAFT_3341464 [Favolaschia claudopus]|uniref:Zn(2)-C6 fungal-type domain-containing protein n=1 Tax=Favolaschia claudopus TaxID=2862362 RepID=A0AAW0E4C4_9AGAR